MHEKRIKWDGGIKGRLIISLQDRVIVEDPHILIDYLHEINFSEDPVQFEYEELEILGAAALFMAVRKISPIKKGNVLDSAASLIGGHKRAMDIGYDWFQLPLGDDMYYFKDGLNDLAEHLRSIQTEAQYTIKCAAFDFIQDKLG